MIAGTASNFKSEVLDFQGKVVVDFWAPWCGPCTMLEPIIEEISAEKPDVKIVKVNVDEEIGLASQFNISSIPAVMIFDQGKAIKTIIGFRQKQEYLQVLD